MLHTRVEAHDWLTVGQYDRQLQLCVPLVVTTGESYRMRDARRTDTTNQTSPKGT